MDQLNEIAREHFLDQPSHMNALVVAIRKKDPDAIKEAVRFDRRLHQISRLFAPRSPAHGVVSLSLSALIRLKTGRTLAVVRCLSYEASICGSDQILAHRLDLRFAQSGDAFDLSHMIHASYHDPFVDKGHALAFGLAGSVRPSRHAIWFPESVPEDPSWIELNPLYNTTERVQMNGLDDGFGDEHYLMTCISAHDFDDRRPGMHWLFDARQTAAFRHGFKAP